MEKTSISKLMKEIDSILIEQSFTYQPLIQSSVRVRKTNINRKNKQTLTFIFPLKVYECTFET